MKHFYFIMTVFIIAVGLVAQAADDSAAIKIDGEIITQAEVDSQTRLLTLRMEEAGRTVPEQYKHMVRKQAADTLLQTRLLLKAARKAGITVSEEEMKNRFNHVKSSLGSPEQFQSFLTRASLTEESFKDQIYETAIVDRYLENTLKDLPETSEEEAKKFFLENVENFKRPERAKASHILIQFPQGATQEEKDAAKKKAEELLKKLKEGADFAELAKENSDCPSSERGGDLGFFTRGRMVPEFEDAAFALEKGEISDIVETKFGYHIIMKTDHRESGTATFNEVKEQLMQNLTQKKKSDRVHDLIESLKKGSEIEYVDAQLDPLTPAVSLTPESEKQEESSGEKGSPEEKK